MRRVWLLIGLVAAVGTGCAQGGSGPQGGGEIAVDTAPEQARGGGDLSAVPGAAALPALAPKVIKTADLEVEVEEGTFGDALQRATAVAGRYGGFVLSSSVQGQEDRTASVLLRVPAERFAAAVGDLRSLGSVQGQRISGEEVGQEFVDLNARLRNLQATEARILGLMREASTIAETIRVQQALERVQLDIEQIQGRLRYLEDQTALATISLHLVEAGTVIPEPAGTIGRAWQGAVEGFMRVVGGVIVVLGYVVPLALLAGSVTLIVRWLIRSSPGRQPSG